MPENLGQPVARTMRAESDLLFATARIRMTTEIADRIRAAVQQEVDWIYLIRLALQHETAPLLYWNLQRVCPQSIPAEILQALAARYKAQETETRTRTEELLLILSAL